MARLRSRLRFRWWQIFILIISWHWRPCKHGADKIRINPGNIGSRERVQAVVDAGERAAVSPSAWASTAVPWKKSWWKNTDGVTAEGIVESALDKVHLIEDMGYDNLVISIKSSDVMMCARAHELIAAKTDYPAPCGNHRVRYSLYSGNIKSAVGLGIILYQGIGDTIRVSLTGDPVEEITLCKT